MSELKNKQKKLLVLASTFPRWSNDTNPPFVFELTRRLTDNFSVTVLAPHYPSSKITEKMGKIKVYRFRYFFEKYEKLAGNGGILPTLKSNKLYYFIVPFFLISEIVTTIRLVNKLKPDIIHAHWIIPQGLAAYLNFLINKTPYVITSHGSDLHSLGFNFVKKIILNHAKKITVVSRYLKDEVGKIDTKLLLKTEVIPMGVDTKQFSSNKYSVNIKNKYNSNGKIVLYVGRLSPEKGVKYLIDAMPLILNKMPKTKLLIIGNGPIKQELENQVKKLNLESKIIFLGAVEHNKLPPYFATADIFVLPSIKEGFGLTVIEALASACPVISTGVGGIKDIVPPTNLIKEKSAESISKKVIETLKKNKTDTLIKTSFNWTEISKKYINCLAKE